MEVTGILHAYSTHSHADGMSLPELKTILFQHGMSFCCLTEAAAGLDTERAAALIEECDQLSDQAFTFVPGFAVPYGELTLLHIGTSVFLGQTEDEAQLRAWREITPWLILARGLTKETMISPMLLSLIDGVEVWDQQHDGPWAPNFTSLRHFKRLQTLKPELKAVGGMNLRQAHSFGAPILTLDVDRLDPMLIVRQLALGFYECSSGRVILRSDGSFASGGGLWTRGKARLGQLWW